MSGDKGQKNTLTKPDHKKFVMFFGCVRRCGKLATTVNLKAVD